LSATVGPAHARVGEGLAARGDLREGEAG